ncbi:glycosyltransferase family 4 protein [Thauera mechernichensis]
MNILFISWDGPQVTYLEGLFLPIFKRLRKNGLNFHILQFTWGDTNRTTRTRLAFDDARIPYEAARVWRRPLALGSLASILRGRSMVRSLSQKWQIDVLMPRSTFPALICLGPSGQTDLPVVFDADGLPLDERVNFAGVSASSVAHRVLRDIEAEMVRRAERVLTRSQRAADVLLARAGAGTSSHKFHVVGNGRDSVQFSANRDLSAATRLELGVSPSAPLLVYAGSLGEQYCVREMLELFRAVIVRQPEARLLILSGAPELAQAALSNLPLLQPATIIKSVSSTEVPRYLACADLGLALRRPSFSMQAVAPIKVGEYLLCGLPVVATNGVGDTSRIRDDIGFLVEQMDENEMEAVADWFFSKVLPDRDGFAKRCRTLGRESFSLDSCVDDYVSAFSGLQIDTARRESMLKA